MGTCSAPRSIGRYVELLAVANPEELSGLIDGPLQRFFRYAIDVKGIIRERWNSGDPQAATALFNMHVSLAYALSVAPIRSPLHYEHYKPAYHVERARALWEEIGQGRPFPKEALEGVILKPQIVLEKARVRFYTTDDNKDYDTTVNVFLKCGGSTFASVSGKFGEWDDNSDSGWIDLAVVEHPQSSSLSDCKAEVVEAPVGHDEWHFNWTLELTFSDGNLKRYDWSGGDVDWDRTKIEHSM
jgi:hypothetical protein